MILRIIKANKKKKFQVAKEMKVESAMVYDGIIEVWL